MAFRLFLASLSHQIPQLRRGLTEAQAVGCYLALKLLLPPVPVHIFSFLIKPSLGAAPEHVIHGHRFLKFADI
jgi:hypothetical protein